MACEGGPGRAAYGAKIAPVPDRSSPGSRRGLLCGRNPIKALSVSDGIRKVWLGYRANLDDGP